MGAGLDARRKPAHGGMAREALDSGQKLLETLASAVGFSYHTRQVQNKPRGQEILRGILCR